MVRKNGIEICVSRRLLVYLHTNSNVLTTISIPMHKGSTFFSEISKFFKKDNADSAISHLSRLFEGLRLSENKLNFLKYGHN